MNAKIILTIFLTVGSIAAKSATTVDRETAFQPKSIELHIDVSRACGGVRTKLLNRFLGNQTDVLVTLANAQDETIFAKRISSAALLKTQSHMLDVETAGTYTVEICTDMDGTGTCSNKQSADLDRMQQFFRRAKGKASSRGRYLKQDKVLFAKSIYVTNGGIKFSPSSRNNFPSKQFSDQTSALISLSLSNRSPNKCITTL